MKRRPPVIATWLLETLGSDPRNDQIAGDLIEQYSLGRSRFWYWRQISAAIVTSLFDQVRSNWLFAFGALLTGWFAWSILNTGLTRAVKMLVNPWDARLPVLAALVWWTAWLTNRAISGWVIGRFYGKGRVAFVLLFSFTVFVWKVKTKWPWFEANYDVPLSLLSIVLAPLFVLLGGLLGAAPRRRDSQAAQMRPIE